MGAHALDKELEAVAAAARAALVRQIEASGAWAADPVWREAFAAVPRHLFVPYYHVGVVGGYERRWGESPDPDARERWVRGAYADTPLATRLRDGELLSSSSQPSLMAMMLAALGGWRTATGCWRSARAPGTTRRCSRTGSATTLWSPPSIWSRRSPSRRAGIWTPPGTTRSWSPVTGRAGCRSAPRSTGSSRPAPWRRSRPPGSPSAVPAAASLTPLATGLVALTVRDAGHAEGHFLHTPAYFVRLRGAGRPEPEPAGLGGVPRRGREHDLFRFLYTLTRGSLDPEEAYALWECEGRPGRERYGITVGGGRQWAWLDDPEGPYAWPLPV
ncbi:methyltransferase domain-containing protein [Streptomyces cinereospinus]